MRICLSKFLAALSFKYPLFNKTDALMFPGLPLTPLGSSYKADNVLPPVRQSPTLSCPLPLRQTEPPLTPDPWAALASRQPWAQGPPGLGFLP